MNTHPHAHIPNTHTHTSRQSGRNIYANNIAWRRR